MEAPTPDVNVEELSFELKKFIDKKKIDLVNPTCPDIQCFPPPDDDDYPETRKFSGQMKAFFDFVDEALVGASDEEAMDKIGKDGVWSKPFDDVMAKAAELVNSDVAFWTGIRDAVIPLYKPVKVAKTEKEGMVFMPDTAPSQWDVRWQKIKLWYDPNDLDVTVVKKMVNKDTGEVVSSDVFEEKTYPGGLVIDIL